MADSIRKAKILKILDSYRFGRIRIDLEGFVYDSRILNLLTFYWPNLTQPPNPQPPLTSPNLT